MGRHFIPFQSNTRAIAAPRSLAREDSPSNPVSAFQSQKALSIRAGVSTRLMYHGFLGLSASSSTQRRRGRSLSIRVASLESGCQEKSSKNIPPGRGWRKEQKGENSQRVNCKPGGQDSRNKSPEHSRTRHRTVFHNHDIRRGTSR